MHPFIYNMHVFFKTNTFLNSPSSIILTRAILFINIKNLAKRDIKDDADLFLHSSFISFRF